MDLSTRVTAAIDNSPHFSQRQWRFETKAGHVTLKGSVSSYFQKQLAQEAIRHIDGVEFIDNDLEVIWGEPTPTAAI